MNNFTARPVTAQDGSRRIKLGDGLEFSVDQLSPDLRQKWDITCAAIERGDDVRAALKTLTHEVTVHLTPQIAMRAVHAAPRSLLDLGLEEKAS